MGKINSCSQGADPGSGKGFHMFIGVGFALLILSHFSKISQENGIILSN